MDPVISQLESLLEEGNTNPDKVPQLLYTIKKLMIKTNLNLIEPPNINNITKCTLRGRLWKAILGATCDFDEYRKLIELAPKSKHLGRIKDSIDQIDRDIPRTFKGSDFVNVNKLSQLKRILTAYHIENPNGSILFPNILCKLFIFFYFLS